MEIYLVGGAVRDLLSGRRPKDRDFVVVGSTPRQMLQLGYLEVGVDFPIFHHPDTNEEYALARTLRKMEPPQFTGVTKPGMTIPNASPHVTLEEDLSRRDLTINSMAMSQDGSHKLIDPFGGRQDLQNRILRHTGLAFSEDPLRVLRVARFLARFGPSWSVAPATKQLMSNLIQADALDNVAPERIWKEIEKGLLENHPVLMLDLLNEVGAFKSAVLADYAYDPANVKCSRALRDAGLNETLEVSGRFALAFGRDWTRAEAKASTLPSQVREVTQGVFRCLTLDEQIPYTEWRAAERLALLTNLDAVRQMDRMELIIQAVKLLRPGMASALQRDIGEIRLFSNAEIIGECKDAEEIKKRLQNARIGALERVRHATPARFRPK